MGGAAFHVFSTLRGIFSSFMLCAFPLLKLLLGGRIAAGIVGILGIDAGSEKKIIQWIALALICVFFHPNMVRAQLFEVSLDERIEKSPLIIEGGVTESQCYRGDDTQIRTAKYAM